MSISGGHITGEQMFSFFERNFNFDEAEVSAHQMSPGGEGD